MAIRKNFTKDELKAFITILKDITGVKYNTRNIPNKESCEVVMYEIISEYAKRANAVNNSLLIAENRFLKTQIEELKKKKANKKWWKFWE